MEMQQLRYAVAVARLASFSRAAERCHVAQPSLSQQIRKLEEELGQRLFVRLRRGARVTPAGERFLARAVRILGEVDAARQESREVRELVRGHVVVGVLPTIAPYLLPGIVQRFGRRHPGVEVIVHEDTTAGLLRLAAVGEIDFAVLSPPIDDARFEVRPLFDEELLLALPAGHRLVRRRGVRLADLPPERFILLREGHCLGDQVTSFCRRGDFQPQVSCRSAQIETVLALVRAGLGISLVPRMAVSESGGRTPEIVIRSLAGERPRRSIGAAWLRGQPPAGAADRFLAEIQPVPTRAGGPRVV